MKADSGASKTYLKQSHSKYLTDPQSLANGPRAILPDNSEIQATSQGDLNLSQKIKHSSLVFPKSQSESLLSIGQICDDGCVAIFDDKSLKIYDGSIKDLLKKFNQLDPVLEGYRNNRDGLYDVPFPQQQQRII